MLLSTKNRTHRPANPPINYVSFYKKSNYSYSWSFDKLCYFSQKIRLLFELIFRKAMLFSTRSPTLSPVDYLINHVTFHKKSNCSSSWTSDKLCSFPLKNLTPPSADPPINYVFLNKKSNSSSSPSSNKLFFFFMESPTPRPADTPIKCYFSLKIDFLIQLILRETVIFHKKSNFSSSWSCNKLCYFSQKNTLLL